MEKIVDLDARDRDTILAIAQRVFKTPVEILAYGSRVDGTAHEGSDLDLVLRSKDETQIDMSEFSNFKIEIEDSNIPILVQVFDWASMPESFRKNVLKNYIVLCKSKS